MPDSVNNQTQPVNTNMIAGAGTGALFGIAAMLYKFPGLRNTILNKLPKTLKTAPGKYTPPDYSTLIKGLEKELRAKGIDPRTAKIGISGAPGSGKSTLSAQIAKAFGSKHVELDKHLKHGSTWEYMKNTLHKPEGGVFDHTTLLTNISPDSFHAIIHVNPKTEKQLAGLLSREHALSYKDPSREDWSSLADSVHFDKLKKAMDIPFAMNKGNVRNVGDVRYVVAPVYDKTHLGEKLLKKNINPSGLNYSDRILSNVNKVKTETEGVAGKQGLSAFSKSKLERPLVAGSAMVAGGAGIGGLLGNTVPDKEALQKTAFSPADITNKLTKPFDSHLMSKALPAAPYIVGGSVFLTLLKVLQGKKAAQANDTSETTSLT